MPILKTATGKEYYCDFFAIAVGYESLWLKVQIDPVEALTVFQNPEETMILEWYGENGDLLKRELAYTRLTGISFVNGKCPVRINLKRVYKTLEDYE